MCVKEASPRRTNTAADRLYYLPKPNSRVLGPVHGPPISLGDSQARLTHVQGVPSSAGRRITRSTTLEICPPLFMEHAQHGYSGQH
jgi:hypothetical protein